MSAVKSIRARFADWRGVLGAALGFSLCAGGVLAQDGVAASEWAVTHFSQVRMIAATSGAGDDASVRIGFHARLDPGWHLYWRTPGETGVPTQFDFSASQNVASVAIKWPAPTRASLLGFNAWVYEDEVVLPMTVASTNAGKAVRIEAAAVYAICKDICTYHNETFVLDLPSGPATPTAYAALIEKYDARVPTPMGDGSLNVARIATAADRVTVEVTSTTPLGAVDAAIEGPPGFTFGLPAVTYGAGRRTAVLEIAFDFVGSERPARADLVLTVMDGARAIERRRVVSAAR